MRNMALYNEALRLLQSLIRNACVNDYTPGSGQEVRSANTLANFFKGTYVKVQRFEPEPGRVSIAFTIPGTDPTAEPLTLLGHIDVVPVEEDMWTKKPFSADIEDGKLYGRGAMDMLFITASMATAVRDVARSGKQPTGTLTFVATADEESRANLGARWIAENEPEAFSWKNMLAETGGSHLPTKDGSDALVVVVGERGAAQRRIHVTGAAGHGSIPYGREFAIANIARVAHRLSHIHSPVQNTELWKGYVKAFRFDPDTENYLLNNPTDFSAFGELASYSASMAHTTYAPTVLRSGQAINVLPSHAYLELDIRPLPGVTDDDVDAEILEALGDLADKVRIERLIVDPATVSPTSGPLYDAIVDTFHEFFPEAAVIPTISAGGSDLQFGRRLGGNGYGFALHAKERTLSDVMALLHAHDEYIELEDLDLTVRAYRSVIRRMVGV